MRSYLIVILSVVGFLSGCVTSQTDTSNLGSKSKETYFDETVQVRFSNYVVYKKVPLEPEEHYSLETLKSVMKERAKEYADMSLIQCEKPIQLKHITKLSSSTSPLVPKELTKYSTIRLFRYAADICNQVQTLNILVMSNSTDDVKYGHFPPGDTAVGASLYSQIAKPNFFFVALSNLTGKSKIDLVKCAWNHQFSILNILRFEDKGSTWRERWIIKICEMTVNLDIDFFADNSGDFYFKSDAIKN